MVRVIGIGELLWDALAVEAGIAPEAVTHWTKQVGGAPANVVWGLNRLGTSAALLGCVGTDAAGQELLSRYRAAGFEMAGMQSHPTAPTREVYVTRTETGDRTFAGFGDRDPADFADAQLEGDQFPLALFQAADVLVLGTIALAYPTSRAALWRALDLADQYHLRIVLDVNWRPMFWPDPTAAPELIAELWPRVDFVKLAQEEAHLFFNTTHPAAIAEYLDSVEGVMVTQGGEGAIAYCLSENVGQVDPFTVPVVDTTGAGDGFVAGFVHQLCAQGVTSLGDPDKAKAIVTYAAAVGALTTQKLGAIAALPTANDVQTFLHRHH